MAREAIQAARKARWQYDGYIGPVVNPIKSGVKLVDNAIIAGVTKFGQTWPTEKIGVYPKEYNPRVHGAYDPGRYYGKPDTKLFETKVGDLPAWFRRRNWSWRAFPQLCSRASWRYAQKYVICKNQNFAFMMHVAFGASALAFILEMKKYRERNQHAMYHW